MTYDGGIYAVPMDFHANLWHVNMDLMEEAGLVEDGKPVLPILARGASGAGQAWSRRRRARTISPPISRSSRSACGWSWR